MDQIQGLLKEHWEKILLVFAVLFFLYVLVSPFLFPSEIAKRSQEVVEGLNQAVEKILKSQPPKEKVPPYGDWLKKSYEEVPPKMLLSKWGFHRRPYVWKDVYSGPQKVKQKPELYPPEDFQAVLAQEGVKLKWKHSSQNRFCQIVKTEVYRRVGKNGDFERIGVVSEEEEEFLDRNVAQRMSYTYYLKVYAQPEETEDVEPFPPGKDVVTSDPVTIVTPPEVLLDVQEYQFGELQYHFVPEKGKDPLVKWRLPRPSDTTQHGRPLRAIKWDSSRRGQKNWVRFIIWKLNRASGKFEEYVQGFDMKTMEGAPIIYVTEEGDRVFDSGFRLVRLGKGFKKGEEKIVVFLENKSVNEELLDVVLSPFGMDGDERPLLLTLEQGEGEKEKKQIESGLMQRESGGTPEREEETPKREEPEEEETPF